MDENKNPQTQPEPAQDPGKPLSEKRKAALLRYMTILFSAAFVLVLISLILQMHSSKAKISELNAASTSALSNAEALQAENRFSRIPVYKEDLDDIVGAVFVKDLVPLLEPGRYADATPEKYMRSVLYVPEGMTCSNLLHAFQKARVHLAIVVDEYGGTEGMVTMEDLLETIVGDLDDEHEEDNAVVTLADGVYEVGGDVPVNELEGLLGEDIFENADCDTIGGFITETLGRIPQAGETLPLETLGYTLTVAEATPRAVTKVTITRTAEKTADPQPAPEQKRRFGRKKDRDGEK